MIIMYWRPKEARYILNREKMEADIILTIEFKDKADIEEFSAKSKAHELSDESFYKLTNLVIMGLEKMVEKKPPTDIYA